MNRLENRLVEYDDEDESLFPVLERAKRGRFWHWNRTYFLIDVDDKIYAIQQNSFERIYAHLRYRHVENYLKRALASRNIVYLLSSADLDVLTYNHAKSTSNREGKNRLDEIYERIETEAYEWRGEDPIHLQVPSAYLGESLERTEWWGRVAECTQEMGLTDLVSQVLMTEEGESIAIDLGCGSNQVTIDLLEKNWKVFCIDYSQKALTVMEEKIAKINQRWLDTNQVTFDCSLIEDCLLPQQVDLIIASSVLPYANPRKMQTIMERIYQALKPGGHFIGNFFVLIRCVNKRIRDLEKEMGTWYMKDKDEVGYLLASQGYHVKICEYGDPRSVLFIGQKV